MTPHRVLVTFVCTLTIVLSFSLRSGEAAQHTSCSPTTIPLLQSAKAQLEAVRDAIADEPSLGETSEAFVKISAALAHLQINIDIIAGTDPCEVDELEPEDFFRDQELAIEEVMDLRGEGLVNGALVSNAENAVRTILAADEALVIAMLAILSETVLTDDSSSDPSFDPNQELSDAQALQAACELPAENVACAPDDPTCDGDGSTCDNALEQYLNMTESIIEIIRGQ